MPTLTHRTTRRGLLQRMLALSGFAAAGLLAACASSPPTTSTTATQSTTTGLSVTNTPAASSSASLSTGSALVTGAGAKGGNLIMANAGADIASLDPQVSGYEATAGLAVTYFDSLIWEDASHQFHPWLADSWESNAEATAYTFHLKKNVVFHDGTLFNAKAVQVNFDRIVNPATQSQYATTLLANYDKTEIVDDYTVTVQFKKPYAAFLDSAARSNLGFASPAALQKYGQDFGRNPVGTGYFKFKEWVPNKQIVLEKNPQYNWGSSAWKHTGPAYLSSYTLISLPDTATAEAAFQRGEIDGVGINNTDVAKYQAIPNDVLVKQVTSGFPRSIFMNVDKAPTNDLNVRKAIIYATDQEAIVKISLGGLAQPAHSPLESPSFGYDPTIAQMYHYDPQMASKLLDGDGWTMGSGGIRAKNGQQLSLIMVVNEGWEPYILPVQQQLKQVGINVQIQTLSSAARVAANSQGQENLAPLGFDSSDPDVLSTVFLSANINHGFAWSRYSSPTLDNLLNQATSEPNQDKRKQLYSQVQKIIMENALIDPLIENTYFSVYEKKLQGYQMDAQGYMCYYDAWIS